MHFLNLSPSRRSIYLSSLRSGRLLGCSVPHQLHASHEAPAAHVPDDVVLVLQLPEAIQQVLPHLPASRPTQSCGLPGAASKLIPASDLRHHEGPAKKFPMMSFLSCNCMQPFSRYPATQQAHFTLPCPRCCSECSLRPGWPFKTSLDLKLAKHACWITSLHNGYPGLSFPDMLTVRSGGHQSRPGLPCMTWVP